MVDAVFTVDTDGNPLRLYRRDASALRGLLAGGKGSVPLAQAPSVTLKRDVSFSPAAAGMPAFLGNTVQYYR